MADVTERKAIELQNRILMQEVGHRSKNLLGVIQAIARQTAAASGSIAEFQLALEGRLQGLAASMDILMREKWLGAPLHLIVKQHIEAFTGIGRVDIAGPDVVLKAEAAQAIGMAMHELATNAVKYGALTSPAGVVRVRWATESDGALRLQWSEQGGPPVAPPLRRGFGQVVLDQMIAGALGGEAQLTFATDGVSWAARLPAECLGTADEAGLVRHTEGS